MTGIKEAFADIALVRRDRKPITKRDAKSGNRHDRRRLKAYLKLVEKNKAGVK